ncbi:MAG: DUF4097 domain-containing protein [Lachnospiraceae bacterium]|nr:DUF4097 domain-containing protein [Lachnospiraceae bacterium]
MKKLMTRVTILILGVFAFCIIYLRGCDVFSVGISSYRYDNASKYTTGGATIDDEVKTLDISWVSGNVNIKYHEENTIIFEEDGSTFEEDEKLRYWLDGTTLRIKYVKSGMRKYGNLNKQLTIYIPATAEFTDLNIDTVSAGIHVEGISADNVRIESVSGSFVAKLQGETSKVDVETVSGKINITGENIKNVNSESVSGAIVLTLDTAPEKINAETVSGKLTAYLPMETGFTLEVDKVSGDFECDFAVTKDNGTYVCGDGSGDYNFETVSGDIYFRIKN